MKGWVYIFSNQAMPGLVKVGFTTKDPELRVSELNHTGSPRRYLVDYDVLVEQPRNIEQKVHKELAEYREGKEWFRCTPEFAISVIQRIVGNGVIAESFKRADRIKAGEIRRRQEEEKKNRERAEAMWQDQERQIRTTYEQRLQQAFPERAVWGYIIVGVMMCLFALVGFGPKLSDGWIMFWSIGLGTIGGLMGRTWHRDYERSSDDYRAILQQRDQELSTVRNYLVIACLKCGQNLRIPRGKKLMVKCSTCRTEFIHQS